MTVDLSTYKSEAPTFDDLTPEQKAALAALADAHPEDAVDTTPEVLTAFTVFVLTDGEVQVSGDLNVQVRKQREPTENDIFGSCAIIQRDHTSQQTAALTQVAMMNMGQAIQRQQVQAQQEAAIRANLKIR